MQGIRLAFLAVVAGALAVSGCAGTEVLDSSVVQTAALQPGMARLTVTRTNDLIDGGSSANVDVNGVPVGNLGPGHSVTLDIPAGTNKIAVMSWSHRGRFSAGWKATAGARYAVQVLPRSSTSKQPGPILGPLAASVGATIIDGTGEIVLRFVGVNQATEPDPAQQIAKAKGS